MKKLPIIFLFAALLLTYMGCGEKSIEGKFSHSPEKPIPGEEVTVYYKASDTVLDSADNVTMRVYQYFKSYPTVETVTLEQKSDYWKGNFVTKENSRIVLLTFAGEEIVDNNSDSGYVVWLYGEKGKKVTGSRAALAALYRGFGSSIDVRTPNEKVLELFDADFENNPELLADYAQLYFTVLKRTQGEAFTDSINSVLEPLRQKPDPTAGDLSTIIAGMMITEEEGTETYMEQLRSLEPDNEMVLRYDLGTFSENENFPEAVSQFTKLKNQHPNYQRITSALSSFLYRSLRAGKGDEVYAFLEESDLFLEYWVYDVAASELLETNPEKALTISRLGITSLSNEINRPQNKPGYLTDKQWRESLENNLGYTLYTYAKALELLGNKKEALEAYEEGLDLLEQQYSDMNSDYISLLIEMEDFEKALAKLEDFIKAGKSNAAMKDHLESTWKRVNSDNTETYEEYFNTLLKEAEVNMREELIGNMMEKEAPDFTLTDLDGNQVSLNDYSGKVVVLDFWATWCGPCISSFPAIQKTVTQFEEQEDVAFLFVNTWENAENKKQNAADFIQKNEYSFHVLLDTENKVVTSYGVKGIPTKFIIDGNGKIRFESIGYDGNDEHLIEELSMMIELAGK